MMSTQQQLEDKITEALAPEHLEVINESHKHNVPTGSESHFKIVVVTDAFNDCPLIERHRIINTLLAEELANRIHALSLRTLTPNEWTERNKQVTGTPPCLGGAKDR